VRQASALVAIGLCLSLALAACTTPAPRSADSSAVAATDLTDALSTLPKATLIPAQPMRLAAELVPPTNRWFSGLVFGTTPQPVFPFPLAVSPTASGLRVALPTVSATADTIFGSAAGGLAVDLGATGFTVTRYDALTVTMTYRNASGPIADVTLAEGWPYVAVTAGRALTARAAASLTRTTSGTWRTEATGTTFGLSAPDATVAGNAVRLPKGATAVFYAVREGVDADALAAGALGVVTGGTAEGGLTAKTATTTLRYTTSGGIPTVLASRPGTRPTGVSCNGGTVLTIYGTSTLCRGTTATTAVPRLAADDTLDLTGATAAERTTVSKQLHADLAATPAEPTDTYAGGKWLSRVANLLQLARALGADAEEATARKLLDDALIRWTEADGCATRSDHCFVYDPVLKGVVGHAASYGSDQFNDHHFHYGYFLSAAAVAVSDRPALRPKLQPVIDLLAADIASPEASGTLPQRRMFDAWAGHSWASGFAPFADGNNQESSSEAVNAWNGLALWAAATGDTALGTEATWLLSSEAAAAQRDWVEPDLSAFPAFTHAFVALDWGGKRDSATWFSPDPAAKLGIQLIPMSPVSDYLGGDPARITRNLAEARSAGTGLFADYLLMYQSLAGGSAVDLQRQAEAIPDTEIDSADSRAYLEAWLASR
jgi:hypothetical protein